MCVIIDTNVIAVLLLDVKDEVYRPVRERLFSSKRPIRLVYGGPLSIEYTANREVIGRLRELDRAARILRINDDKVRVETIKVVQTGVCRSNDAHIIALARVSKARVLVSCDKDLQVDFKNGSLIEKPRGKVYKRPAHSNLLKQCAL